MKPIRTPTSTLPPSRAGETARSRLPQRLPTDPPWRCHTDLHRDARTLRETCDKRNPTEGCVCS